MHITPKASLRLVLSQPEHAWIHKNICNTSTRTLYFPLHPSPTLSLILSLSPCTYIQRHTHTLPQAPSANSHTTVHCRWHSKHDTRALRGHLPVSHPCQPKALWGGQFTHTHTHTFGGATESNNRSSWTNTATLLQWAHVVLGLSPGPGDVYFMD